MISQVHVGSVVWPFFSTSSHFFRCSCTRFVFLSFPLICSAFRFAWELVRSWLWERFSVFRKEMGICSKTYDPTWWRAHKTQISWSINEYVIAHLPLFATMGHTMRALNPLKSKDFRCSGFFFFGRLWTNSPITLDTVALSFICGPSNEINRTTILFLCLWICSRCFFQ